MQRKPVKLISPPPPIETKRLLLRALEPEDIEDYFALYSNVKVTAGHGMAPWKDPEQALHLMDWYAQAAIDNRGCRWAITERGPNRLIGSLGYHAIEEEHYRGEIGYDLLPEYWGRGIGSEAVVAVVRFGFEEIGFHRIEAIVDPDNQASAGLLRKVGFTEEGYLRERYFDNGRFVDDWMFSILRPEFEIQHPKE